VLSGAMGGKLNVKQDLGRRKIWRLDDGINQKRNEPAAESVKKREEVAVLGRPRGRAGSDVEMTRRCDLRLVGEGGKGPDVSTYSGNFSTCRLVWGEGRAGQGPRRRKKPFRRKGLRMTLILCRERGRGRQGPGIQVVSRGEFT